jgi:hypothetical protein
MPMRPDALTTLRQVNGNLRSALFRFCPERQHCSAIKPQDLSDLASEILRASDYVRCISFHSEAGMDFKNESLEYRRNLEQLKQLLLDLQSRLLVERSRLESARNHIAAAADWAGTSAKTLRF